MLYLCGHTDKLGTEEWQDKNMGNKLKKEAIKDI